MRAQRLAADLGVHRSTVSRQCAHLERAGLLRSREEHGNKLYPLQRGRVGEICRRLMQALGVALSHS